MEVEAIKISEAYNYLDSIRQKFKQKNSDYHIVEDEYDYFFNLNFGEYAFDNLCHFIKRDIELYVEEGKLKFVIYLLLIGGATPFFFYTNSINYKQDIWNLTNDKKFGSLVYFNKYPLPPVKY